MKKLALSALGAATIAGGLAAAPLATAQPTMDAPRMSQRAHPLPGERIEARLAYAKTALKITPAQEAQWNALAEVLRHQARAMDEAMAQRRATAGDQAPKISAIGRLEQRQKFMADAATRMNEVLEAAKPLYASLTDDQKKEADALLNRGGRRGGHSGRWH